MSDINDKKVVEKQYATSTNLNTRISIHDKYSTNKQGFGNWIYSHYEIADGSRVLELGCGTGSMWKGHDELIKKCAELVLSDFSEAMVETTRNTIGELPNITYRSIDIQNIPYDSATFDVVIANMMLYHVPDLPKALAEVRRVLKPNGKFYCATYGEHGIVEYLSKLLGEYGVEDNVNKNFTLQNGASPLSSVFKNVRKESYKDSLAVTNITDLVDYIYSLSSMSTLSNVPREKIQTLLQGHMINGVLTVPKEYGLFIAN
ncbi:MAG: class I SAM-dependent methyltransferase [Treponema sp.]|nr:class I SAM-dependent methyltransferase [Treponema sp.]